MVADAWAAAGPVTPKNVAVAAVAGDEKWR